MSLPEPMLARSGCLPEGSDWRFELKLDGFRAIVSTTGGLRVRSRRGWDMSSLVPELGDLPPRLTLDGETRRVWRRQASEFPPPVRAAASRTPWHRYRLRDLRRPRMGRPRHPELAVRQRRELLEDLNLRGSHWDTAMAFEDGARLFRSVQEIGLEGVVAKKLSQRYRPGERLWVKVKNRDYWRSRRTEAAGRAGPRPCSQLGSDSRAPPTSRRPRAEADRGQRRECQRVVLEGEPALDHEPFAEKSPTFSPRRSPAFTGGSAGPGRRARRTELRRAG